MNILVTCAVPTQKRKKLTVAKLEDLVSFYHLSTRKDATHKIFRGLMTKHHLVQMQPVAIKAKFCVRDKFSAGRAKSATPARTMPHFMIGALLDHYQQIAHTYAVHSTCNGAFWCT